MFSFPYLTTEQWVVNCKAHRDCLILLQLKQICIQFRSDMPKSFLPNNICYPYVILLCNAIQMPGSVISI